MTTPRRPPLELEQLGDRLLPSAALFPAPPPGAAAVPAAAAPSHVLDGRGHGSYAADASVPDAGTKYSFSGAADLAGMGHVQVTGWVDSVGFVARGRAHGFLTFTNHRGTVTVEVFGPPQAGSPTLPERFNFNVVGVRTGAFAHLSAKGTLTLDLHATLVGGLHGLHGAFALTVGSPRPSGSL